MESKLRPGKWETGSTPEVGRGLFLQLERVWLEREVGEGVFHK